jgi:methyl-accepting chemotaxis protein
LPQDNFIDCAIMSLFRPCLAFLAPAMLLMQRLRLLPKFALVCLMFAAPLMLSSCFLFSELAGSIAATKEEQRGLADVRELQNLMRLLQKHRGLRHMQIGGNAKAGELAMQTRAEINAAMARFDRRGAAASAPWRGVQERWTALKSGSAATDAKEIHARHDAILAELAAWKTSIADRSGLTLDPAIDSFHLSNAFLGNLPPIADSVMQLAGRGAAYIDTGLFEGGEDVMLNSLVMVARRDLAHVPGQFEAAFRENPALRATLEPRLASLKTALAFLDRAKDEVLNAYNQTSGNAFFDAGNKSADALYATADSAAQTIDALLQARIERDTTRMALIAAAIAVALLAAVYLLAGFYLSFSRDVAALEDAAARAAQGDLSGHIRSHSADEIGHFANAFGAMNKSLASLVAKVRNTGNVIGLTAHELAADSAALSARTEAQAGALQQTASAIEQLTSVVKQNEQSAADANRLADSAAEVARKGGTTVGRVTATMRSIKDRSSKILDIIGVIDGIAFQTNILALNAAVEAARAGAQGRGFAVVAAEVRNLAQRSAAAAKEIKALIESSVEQINEGDRQAEAAGTTMRDIVDAIQHVAALMQDISSASREQSAGIAQVNQAVCEMEGVTQRNAVLVEHAAATAEALGLQASRLSQAVAAFKLDDEPEGGQAISAAAVVQFDRTQMRPLRRQPAAIRTPDIVDDEEKYLERLRA